jgi:hypothetical protein
VKSKLKIDVIHLHELEHPFRQGSDGWLGGDCAFSLPLSNDRVLWLFGDSFVQNNHQVSREGAFFINNSIAIQTGNLLSDRDSLHFYWKKENGNHRAFFETENDPGFLWPLSAVKIDHKVFVFAVRIVNLDPTKVFGFQQIGQEIIEIENPHDDPGIWKMTIFKQALKPQLGSFVSNFFKMEDYLYIYGYRNLRPGWNDPIINLAIARIKNELAQQLYDTKNWEFLDGTTGRWSPDIHHTKPVIEHFTTEFSVSYLPELKKYVLISNGWKHPHPITVRFSDMPFGPFGEPQIVYHCPEIKWSPNYFCYAAKAHPELSQHPNELIVSYMNNSKIFQDCFDDLRIYFPRFVKILFHE